NVAALPNGRRFVTAGEDGVVRLWDLDTGEVVREFPKQPVPVYGLEVTRDGRRVVAGTWESKRNGVKMGDDLSALPPVHLILFEIATGQEVKRGQVPASVAQVHLSADCRF